LEKDVANKDALIEELQVELTKTQESTLRDRLTLAYNLACIYKAARQYTKAEAEFMKALALDPDDPGVHFNLGILYDDNLDDARKALVHYQRFLELAPHDKDAPKVIEWMSSLH
jgi:tetratricopeptide (TPR) repeat protein